MRGINLINSKQSYTYYHLIYVRNYKKHKRLKNLIKILGYTCRFSQPIFEINKIHLL